MCNKNDFLEIFSQSFDRDIYMLRDDTAYGEARLVYNRMHDCHPLVIFRSLDPNKIYQALQLARKFCIPVAVRGGGHHIGGFSTIDNGLLIDFSTFRNVRYDNHTKLVSVQPGARLGDIDIELASFDRCIPTGTVSDTGITGLTLGGGIGWLVCSAGLTCDYLDSIDIQLCDGRFIKASKDTHDELFTALRGGGIGGFGVITQLHFRTIPLPDIIAGSVIFNAESAPSALEKLFHLQQKVDLKRTTIAAVLSPDYDKRLSVDLCCSLPDAGELELIRSAIGGSWHNVFERSYTQWQRSFDSTFLPPKRGYWKSVHFEKISADPLQICQSLNEVPSNGCALLIEFYNPDVLSVYSHLSAYPRRNSKAGILLSGRWDDSNVDKDHIAWVRKWSFKFQSQGGCTGYSNYSSQDENIGKGYSSDSLTLFSKLSDAYDPEGVFSRGHRNVIMNRRNS